MGKSNHTSKDAHSNFAWITGPRQHKPQQFLNVVHKQPLKTSQQDYAAARSQMVSQLRLMGADEQVLKAMNQVPRHRFVDTAFALRAYELNTLSIGHQQTISQPWVVARMLSLVFEQQTQLKHCLEIGTGCGYQAAVMAQCAQHVYSIERIQGLYQFAKLTLTELGVHNVQLLHGDGALGWHDPGVQMQSGFDAIVVAAAGLDISTHWLMQLNIGAKLVAPVILNAQEQQLCVVQRIDIHTWTKTMLDRVQFVPLLQGMA